MDQISSIFDREIIKNSSDFRVLGLPCSHLLKMVNMDMKPCKTCFKYLNRSILSMSLWTDLSILKREF